MVKLRVRPPAPDLLVNKQAEWTKRWEEGSADWATKAAKDTIRSALRSFSNGKCAYCEIRLDWRPTGVEIEHYIAKTIRRDLAFEWTNLFASCSGCNNMKRDSDHAGNLIKPDDEDPEVLLAFNEVTGDIEPRPDLSPQQTLRAQETIRICGLTRGDLSQRRLEAYQLYKGLLAAVLEFRQNGNPNAAQQAEDLLCNPVREFKLVLRTMLWLEGFPHLATEDCRRFGSHP